MKEFSLEEYLKNPSLKVVTRIGKPVRIICTDAKNDFPIVALVTTDDKEVLMDYDNNGGLSPEEMTNFDLFFATEKKEHFEPNTLQPFDKVLVRFNDRFIWKCDLFSHIKESDSPYIFHCISGRWWRCVPYNDDTKHLVGTSDEAPDYYRYWEE